MHYSVYHSNKNNKAKEERKKYEHFQGINVQQNIQMHVKMFTFMNMCNLHVSLDIYG